MPEFSIVIPVYKGEHCIGRLLEGILNQSFKDFEVVCVDDASPDDSFAVLSRFAQNDARIRVFRQRENGGSSRARRRGVLKTSGRYVLFADQDDEFCEGALCFLHHELKKNASDIVSYDAEVQSVGKVDPEEVRGVQDWVKAFSGSLCGKEIVDACFINNKYGYSIWNKAYNGSMARMAFSKMEDVLIPLGEDNYAYFVLAYFAKTFRGAPGRYVYRYHYGAGFTGRGTMSIADWARTMSLSFSADLIKTFLDQQQVFELYANTYFAARKHMVEYAFAHFRREISFSDKTQAIRMALEHWRYEEVLEALALHSPQDVPLLVDIRFEGNSLSPELAQWVSSSSLKMVELEASICEAQITAENVRAEYESSASYKLGRKITTPLRMLRRGKPCR